jgi:hypothetical protein
MLPGERELLLMPNCRFAVSGALPTSDGMLLVHANQVERHDRPCWAQNQRSAPISDLSVRLFVPLLFVLGFMFFFYL